VSACDACLRRSSVIAAVAPRIEGLMQKPSERIGEVLALPDDELLEALMPADRLDEARTAVAAFDADHARADAERASLATTCRHDRWYPEPLAEMKDSPAVLWVRGSVERLDELLREPAVAIVGSRRASAYGLEMAEELGRSLSAVGVTVISGLAQGIDGAAHRGALRSAAPRTVAVLGSGADVVYPQMHRRLYDEIAEVGAVVSELPPGRRPFRWTFPARNRIMAALAAMTVVVEATQPSGSLITASFALDLHRQVGAVPGRVTAATSAGTNQLLRDNSASVIRHAGDVLDELFGAGSAERCALTLRPAPVLTDTEQRVLAAVEHGEDSGRIADALALEPGQVRATLGRLEMAGLIARTGIGSYERRAARHP
jgi:DNA processing protein